LLEIDRWALHRLQGLIRRVRQGYAGFEFHAVFHALNNFCAVDLSAIYFDILKDRLYSDPAGSASRRAAQRVLFESLTVLTRLMAPILSFTAEEIWNQIPREQRDRDSVHLASFPDVNEAAVNQTLADNWERLLAIRDEVARALEQKRMEKMIRSSQEAAVILYAKGDSMIPRDSLEPFPHYAFLQERKALLSTLFIVSQVDLLRWEEKPEGLPVIQVKEAPLAIQVLSARGTKCGRCWFYREDVGGNPTHPELCARCAGAVG